MVGRKRTRVPSTPSSRILALRWADDFLEAGRLADRGRAFCALRTVEQNYGLAGSFVDGEAAAGAAGVRGTGVAPNGLKLVHLMVTRMGTL